MPVDSSLRRRGPNDVTDQKGPGVMKETETEPAGLMASIKERIKAAMGRHAAKKRPPVRYRPKVERAVLKDRGETRNGRT